MNHNKRTHEQEKLFQEIANAYVGQYGDALRKELSEIPERETPMLDKRVKKRIGEMRRGRWLWRGSAAVAAMLLVFLLPRLLQQSMSAPSPDQSEAAPSLFPSTTDMAAAPGSVPNRTADVEPYEIIPLRFSLSEEFSVSHVEQDREETVYYLENTQQDDVVLALKRADQADTEGLYAISVEDQTVYGAYRADFSLLTFQKDGIVYEMSCCHDINTLLGLSQKILL